MSEAGRSETVSALCERHHAIDVRQNEIHALLGALEEGLAKKYQWLELTRAQRRALPAAQPFYDLEDELEQLGHQSAQLVAHLRGLPSTSLHEAASKLSVVARTIEPDDYPVAYEVLLAATEEVRAFLSCRSVVMPA